MRLISGNLGQLGHKLWSAFFLHQRWFPLDRPSIGKRSAFYGPCRQSAIIAGT